MNSWMPRKKVQAGALAGTIVTLIIAFSPRLGITFNTEEIDALGALVTLIATVGTAYMVPGEPLAHESEE